MAVLVPLEADVHFAEEEPPQPAIDGGVSPGLGLDFTPARPGQYLILVLANFSEAPGTSPVFMRFMGPAGAYWPSASADILEIWQCI